MQAGISVWAYKCAIEEAIRQAAQTGFEVIELALNETGALSLESSEKEILGYKALAQDEGIQLKSLATGLYWKYGFSDEGAMAQKSKDICKKQLEFAALLGADSILVVPGSVTAKVPYDVAYDRALAATAELAPFAQAAGVKIGLENVWNKFLLSPLEYRRFIDEINHPFVGMYFDVGNVLVNGYPEQWIDILGKRIVKVHFKDFRTSVGSIGGFCDMLEGDVDYKSVMAAFRRTGYDGPAVAEVSIGNADFSALQYKHLCDVMKAILAN